MPTVCVASALGTLNALLAHRLVVLAEERSTLGVGLHLLSPLEVFSSRSRDGDDHGGNEQGSHNGEGENPLESNNLSEELSNADGGGEHAQVETHGVVLVHNNEEQAISQDRPDEDVAKDSGNERLGVGHHDGAVPVDGNKVPCERAGYDSLVDEASVGRVAEVERGQVEEVDNDQNLGPSKVASHEEHDESEMEQVVEDEVASHGASSVQLLDVAGEQVEDVATLQDEQHNPIYSLACHVANHTCVLAYQ